jgi:protein-tyrosine phosphatase
MSFNLSFQKLLEYNTKARKRKKRFNKKTKYVSHICSGIYLTDWEYANKISYLVIRKIKSVLTINTDKFRESTSKRYKELRISHLYIHATDFGDSKLSSYWNDCYHFIRKGLEEGGVLIHCTMGISRSPATLMYILLRYFYEEFSEEVDTYLEDHEFILSEIIFYLGKHRPIIWPIKTFTNQLEELEKGLQLKRFILHLMGVKHLHNMRKKKKFCLPEILVREFLEFL